MSSSQRVRRRIKMSEIGMNMTNSLGSTAVSDFGSWFGVVLTVLICSILILTTIMILSSLERYKNMNTTSDFLTALFTSSLIVGFLAWIVFGFYWVLKLWKFLRWLKQTVGYFGWGFLSIIVTGIPTIFIYWELNQATKGNVLPIKWTILPIIIYILISLIGYLTKTYVVDRIKKFNKEMKDRKK